MTTAITKESLAARIADLEYGPRSLKEDYTLAAYKMLLAVMEAEPVADVVAWSHPTEERTCDIRWRRHDVAPGPLYYRAQPAPVVPECFLNAVSALESLYRNGQKQCWHERYTTDMAYASGVLNACRAAKLSQK